MIERQITAFVSIQQGCNMDCSFCIVPKTRGDERSRPMDAIVAECRVLAARGVREVTLLGQIVTSYGRRDYPHTEGISPFVQLLEKVSALDGIERIRFTSPTLAVSKTIWSRRMAGSRNSAVTCTCRCRAAATASSAR